MAQRTKFVLIIAMSFLLSACATKRRMDIDDLKFYQIDCNNKEAQLQFLHTQLPTQTDRLLATFKMTGIGGLVSMKMDGSYKETKAIMSREYDAVAKRLIWELRQNCH